MSQRQSRQAKHIQSIQKIFTEYDDKIQMRTSSPQPSSPYPSSRFAIHRKKSPNGIARNNNNNININNHKQSKQAPKPTKPTKTTKPTTKPTKPTKTMSTTLTKAKSLNSSDITSPVTSIGSMFDTKKKSSIADLHKNNLLNDNEDDIFRSYNDNKLININIPDYNTEIILNKFEKETKTLNEICINYQSLQQSLSQIVREQSVCIKQLLKELDKKNNKIKELEILLKHNNNNNNNKSTQKIINKQQIHHKNIHETQQQFNINNTNINNMNNRNNMNNMNNININRKLQKHSVNKKSVLCHDQRFNGNNDEEYEQIIRHVPIHTI